MIDMACLTRLCIMRAAQMTGLAWRECFLMSAARALVLPSGTSRHTASIGSECRHTKVQTGCVLGDALAGRARAACQEFRSHLTPMVRGRSEAGDGARGRLHEIGKCAGDGDAESGVGGPSGCASAAEASLGGP